MLRNMGIKPSVFLIKTDGFALKTDDFILETDGNGGKPMAFITKAMDFFSYSSIENVK